MNQHEIRIPRWEPLPGPAGYGLAVVLTGLAALVRWLLPWVLSPAPYLGFYPAVVVSAALGGVGPGLVSTFASLLLVNFVFGRFNINDHGAIGRQVIWVLASIGVSLLAGMQRAARLQERRYAEELRASEEALRQSEEKYRTLFNTLIVGFCIIEVIFDSDGRPVDYRFLEINPAFEAQTGLQDAQGRLMREMAPDHEAHWFEIYGKIALTGEPARFVNEAKALNRWYDVSAYRIGQPEKRQVAILFNDITSSKRAEEALQERETRFRTMANAMPQLAWIARADGHIFWYNQRWYDYTGTIPEQMEGWGWQSVHDPSELPKVLERWQVSIVTGEPFDMTFPLRGADGVFRMFLTRVIPLTDTAGRVLQWFGTNTDISALKLAEEQIRASLAEKDVMLREIHHRVKNNLQVISSLVSLQSDGSENETVRKVLLDVTDRVRSMALVHEKLYQSVDLARINFAEYARSLMGYLWRAHGDATVPVGLTFDLEPLSLPVDTAVPCGLILNELAGNSLKHAFRGRAGGEVTVALHGGADGCISLSVADNGIGLPAGLEWRRSGSLGLRLVQMLAKQLDAEVQVSGVEGTMFEISFKVDRLKTEG